MLIQDPTCEKTKTEEEYHAHSKLACVVGMVVVGYKGAANQVV